MPAKILVVAGTRPESIKLAPVILQLGDRAHVYLTGQHPEMAASALLEFGIKANESNVLNVDSLTESVSHMVYDLGEAIRQLCPKLCVVQGDTASAYSGALAAFLHQIPVMHVESGLRSYDNKSPFPEEALRRSISAFTTYHCAPTESANRHLHAEILPFGASIKQTGNTIVDAVKFALLREPSFGPVGAENLVVASCHRRENASRIGEIAEQLLGISQHASLVFFRHPNQWSTQLSMELQGKGVVVMDPMPYVDTIHVLNEAKFIVTDSGGIQEEASALGKPCILLRESTERREGIGVSVSKPDLGKVAEIAVQWLTDEDEYERFIPRESYYGDGGSAKLIAQWAEAVT